MCLARIVAIFGLVGVGFACAAGPDQVQDRAKLVLTEYYGRALLYPALREFVVSPGTKPDRKFVSIGTGKEGEVLFENVPEGWSTWKDGKHEGRVLHRDGFWLSISLKQVSDVEAAMLDHVRYAEGHRSIVLLDQMFTPGGIQVSRIVKCKKFKGETEFTELRYFHTGRGGVCIELRVVDCPKEKRTLNHLLAHLRSHYGEYEGACQQVADILRPEP